LPGHECQTARYAGFGGLENGALLTAAENAKFDVLMTVDRGIEFQQDLGHRNIAILILCAKSIRLKDLPTAARISGLSAPARRRCASENIMKKRTERRRRTDELRREYDLSKLKGVRGKYATRYQAGTNLVLLSPDVAKYFPEEQSVNMALRKLIHVTKVKRIS